ncbi:purine nucleoside phosphorylase [Streptococcus pneumoniae]|nr:purine nucleoside phosphorylase [Streptococcus pneumoniae]
MKKLIRVGTAGSLNEEVHVRELVLAQESRLWKWKQQLFTILLPNTMLMR